MNNDQATQNRPGGRCRRLRANMSRPLQAVTLAAAIVAGGVWYAATPGSNGLTLDRQDQAADADFRAQAQGQLLAASHESIREFVATIPLASGEQPGRDDHSVSLLAAPGNAGLKENNNGANPDNDIAEPTAAIPHQLGERVVDGSFATDGEAGSRQEQVDRYAHEVNAGRPETEVQSQNARLLDLWALAMPTPRPRTNCWTTP